MVDPKHAPEGYIAVPWPDLTCRGCAFLKVSCPGTPSCLPKDRPDGEDVIFVKENTPDEPDQS